MPPPEIAALREKVRRRAFLVRERAKLMAKIRVFWPMRVLSHLMDAGFSRVRVWIGLEASGLLFEAYVFFEW